MSWRHPILSCLPAGCCLSAVLGPCAQVRFVLCHLRQMFTRKFERLAASYSDAVFCDVLGDENNDTRVRHRASPLSLNTPVLCGSSTRGGCLRFCTGYLIRRGA